MSPARSTDPSNRELGPRLQPRAGMTFAEVLVGLLVLITGILGLSGTTGYAMRQSQLSAVAARRSIALQTVIERIKAQDYDDVADGDWSDGTFRAKWTVSRDRISKEVTIVTTGPGMVVAEGRRSNVRGEVQDTFAYRVLMP